MSIVSLVAIYFVVWWVILFAVLPFGVRTQAEEGDIVLGTTHSAPARPLLMQKAIATTVAAGVLVFGFWFLVEYYGLDLEAVTDLIYPIR